MMGLSSIPHRPLAPGRDPRRAWAILAGLALTVAPTVAVAGDASAGERTYRDQCARCHGKAGEGSAEFPRALAGDRSVGQLARLIAETMPEDDPGACTGPDAERVASYIYESFYSRTARARNAPARVELARLTVRQYRNAVADLIGGFREPGHWGDRRGLEAEYFKDRRMDDGNIALKRTDPVVRFDFQRGSPDPEKIKPKEYAIRWHGSVLAPETGEYEFIVRTENSIKLWVDDARRPLIDAWVKSGKDTEHRGAIRLLGGRAYPIRLEFAKGKDGVRDKKPKKDKEEIEPASVALEWKPPHRAAEVIPARNLSPAPMPETFVLETPFPPDDRSIGYERGTSVSRAWDAATTDAAIEVADYVAARLKDLAGAPDGPDREKRLREFSRAFAERAFRRPLRAEEVSRYVDRQFAAGRRPEEAVKRVVMLVLKSPRFLYRELDAPAPYAAASRLAFGLWDSLPDRPLLDAARDGKLATAEQLSRQAERMLGDLRARAKLREFFLQWLKVDAAPELAKDAKLFPGFDAAVASDLRTSLDLFLEDVAWGDSPDFRRLLTADSLYLNGRLARLYGADLPADAPFTKVPLDPNRRAGVLTHPYLLATFAYHATSSPIHRGVFLSRGVLGRTLRPPPEAVAPSPAEAHAGMTTRQRVALQTSPAACQTCHALINPLGYTLEAFDAIGRFREAESGQPIDASGSYQARDGNTVTFAGARDLAEFLAGSAEVHDAFVEKLFHQVVQQPVLAYGPRRLDDLRRSFAAHGFRIRDLLVEIAASTALGPEATKQRAKPSPDSQASHRPPTEH